VAFNQMVVFVMRANPKPHYAVRRVIKRQRAIMETDANRPQLSNLLEVK